MDGVPSPTDPAGRPTPDDRSPTRVRSSTGDGTIDRESPDARRRQTRRFGLLLLSTVTTYVVQGIVPPNDPQHVAVTALVSACLLLAVRAGELPEWFFRTMAVLAVVAITLSVAHVVFDDIGDATTRTMNAALIAVAPPAVALGVIREIRGSGQVRLAAVMGVLALYMLIGMLFGFVYGAIDRLGGGPFFAQDTDLTNSNALYFSFTTLTTVGFGDLTARSDVGHTIAAFEALVGQVYLVTVVAALVGNLRRPARR